MAHTFDRQRPEDLVRVGAVTGSGGHMKGIWAATMNPPAGQIRTTGMLLTHVWCLRQDTAREVEQLYPGVTVVANPSDMIGHVDGVYIDDINAISLYPMIAKPFLRAGLPTFVNRPFATSMTKGREMIAMADASGAPLLTASTWEYTESVGDLRAKASEMQDIKGYVAHNSMSDYYTHGIHGVWYIHAVLRDEIRKGRGRMTGAAYHSPDWRTSNGQVVFEHDHPESPYYGNLHLVSGADGQAYMRIFGDNRGDAEGKIPARPGHFRYNTWNALQLVIQEMFETGKAPESGDDLMEKLAMFLLPFHSITENDGRMTGREALDGWELPNPSSKMILNGQPTDSAFQDPYSENKLADLANQLAK